MREEGRIVRESVALGAHLIEEEAMKALDHLVVVGVRCAKLVERDGVQCCV